LTRVTGIFSSAVITNLCRLTLVVYVMAGPESQS